MQPKQWADCTKDKNSVIWRSLHHHFLQQIDWFVYLPSLNLHLSRIHALSNRRLHMSFFLPFFFLRVPAVLPPKPSTVFEYSRLPSPSSDILSLSNKTSTSNYT